MQSKAVLLTVLSFSWSFLHRLTWFSSVGTSAKHKNKKKRKKRNKHFTQTAEGREKTRLSEPTTDL